MGRRATRQNSAPRIGHVGILLDCHELRSKRPELIGQLATIIALEQDDRCRVRLDGKAETEAIVPISAFLSEFTDQKLVDGFDIKKPRRSPGRNSMKSGKPASSFSTVEPNLLETAHDLAMLKETAQQLTALHSSPLPKRSDSMKDSITYCSVCLMPYGNNAMIQCDNCNCWVHAKCDGITPTKLSRLRKDKNAEYFCPVCRQPVSPTISQTDQNSSIQSSSYYDGELSQGQTSGILTSICVLVASIQENRRRLRFQQRQQQQNGDLLT